MRRHLAAVFGVWLFCHACALAIAPVSMCVALRHDAESVCSCGHTSATQCPMHHSAPAKSKSDCACRSTSDAGASMLATLFGPVALVSLEARVEPPLLSAAARLAVLDSIVPVLPVPEPPPPRA